MGPERLVQIKKWNCQNKILVLKVWSSKIFVEIRESRAKAARKARES